MKLYLTKEDFNGILKNKGKIIGYSNTVKFTDFKEDIFNNILKDQFKKASEIIEIYTINTHADYSIFELNKIIDLIGNLSDGAIINLQINNNKNIARNEISYSIILFGL